VDAHRSTAYVICPYTKSGAVIHTNYNSTNVVRTIEDILGVHDLGLNDVNARPMSDVFIKQPNLQPYVAPIPGILCHGLRLRCQRTVRLNTHCARGLALRRQPLPSTSWM